LAYDNIAEHLTKLLIQPYFGL